VPTMTLHPASAKCFVIAHPYPLASATPAMKAVLPRRSTLNPSMAMVREEEEEEEEEELCGRKGLKERGEKGGMVGENGWRDDGTDDETWGRQKPECNTTNARKRDGTEWTFIHGEGTVLGIENGRLTLAAGS